MISGSHPRKTIRSQTEACTTSPNKDSHRSVALRLGYKYYRVLLWVLKTTPVIDGTGRYCSKLRGRAHTDGVIA